MIINTNKINDKYDYLTGKLLSVFQIVADELTDRGYTVSYAIYKQERYVEGRKNEAWVLEEGKEGEK